MRVLLSCLAVGLLAGCTAVQVVQPKQLRYPNPLTRVWVTRADRSVIVLDSASIRGDSLFGLLQGEHTRIPLQDAAQLRIRQPSEVRTQALLITIGAGVAAITLYAAHHRFLDSSP